MSGMTIPDQKVLDKIRAKHGLDLVLLHGSQVTGRLHDKSDIDIAVLPRGGFDLLGIISDLVQAFHSDKVDVTNLLHADPLLLYTVTTKSKLLSGDKKDYDLLKIRAFMAYNDYLPYLDLEYKVVLRNLEKYVAS